MSSKDYLYEFDIYTGVKETTGHGLGEFSVLQQTEKLNRSFCCIFFYIFFTWPSLLRKMTDHSLYGIGVVRQNRKLLPKIEKPTKKKFQTEKKLKKQQKPKEFAHGSSFTSEESFNRGDSNYCVNKDGLAALQWKDSKVVMLLTNCMGPLKLTSVERLQKGTSERWKVPWPAIIKEYNSHMNGVDILDRLKTSYEIDLKSRFQYYLRISFDLMDSVVVNAHVIYKKKVNPKMSLLNFKIILAESLMTDFLLENAKTRSEISDKEELRLNS